MGLRIKKILLRTAATLTATTATSAMAVRGARFFWFEIGASDANTLGAGTLMEVSNDGTNFVSCASAVGKNGFILTATTSIISVALNAGPVLWIPTVNDPGGGSAPPVVAARHARLTLAKTGTNIAGLYVYGYAAYEHDGPTHISEVTVDEGPNI